MTRACSETCGVGAYEDLRREVLSGETVGSGSWGLALVIQRGLPAWFDALARREDQTDCARPQLRQIVHHPVRDDWPVRSEITRLLADMILAGRREVRA